MIKYKRRRYLINRSLQLRYIAMVAILMIAIAIVTGWMIYSTTWETLITQFEGESMVLDKVFTELNSLLLIRISLLILAGVCLSAILLLFVIHRIAGPLFRAKKTMELIGQGVIPEKITFRKKDELKELADAINEAISRLEQFRQMNSEALLENARSRLDQELETVEADIAKLADRLETKGNYSLGAGDPAITQWEMNLALKERAVQKKEEIEAALARIEQGTYGICSNCGKQIEPERLELLPTTTLCSDCMQKAEH